ncbi:PREDICTED: probable cytochrome P450 318a1 isoform X1 [Bactrocera latifrons]|uniref:Putative cytochrome P450 318a1 n=3 Tax=Bactrocera latifrons TaxID=174628 RepID=A0A0K8W519_BACLA|nr:PREDICTED: probable cytochrome P450 318a1 isoform X1 [Bactrocera latifrons]
MLQVTLLVLLLLICTVVWWQRNAWLLVWRLNGWRGLLQQPYLWFILIFYLEPKKLLQVVSHIRPYFQRPLGIVFGNKSVIYVDDPTTMEQFFNAPECIDKSFFQDGFCLKRGLLHARGAAWKSRRRQLDPAFGSKVLLNFIDTFNTVGNQLVHKFETQLLGDNIEFETLDEMFSRAVLEVSCQTTMGTETNFTAADTQGIAKTYSELMGISALRGTKPWLQVDFLFRWLDAQNYKRCQELMKHLEDFVRVIVQKKHAEWRASGECHIGHIGIDNGGANADSAEDVRNIRNISSENTSRKRIFIEQIFHMVDSGELRMEDVMDEALSMLMVSFETISTSVLVIMLLLAMHEDHQRKLRAEIAATFPKEQHITNIDPVQLLQMKYLDAIVYESLRLLTTVPFNMRAVSRDFFIDVSKPNGSKWRAKIPKDTAIVFDAFNMQRDPKYWGPHAQEFYPEHFVTENSSAAGRHPYAFVPFAKGLRYCIGNRYSMYLAKIFIVKLIHHFEFGTSTKLSDLHFVNGISLKFGNSEIINFHIKKIERTGV